MTRDFYIVDREERERERERERRRESERERERECEREEGRYRSERRLDLSPMKPKVKDYIEHRYQ